MNCTFVMEVAVCRAKHLSSIWCQRVRASGLLQATSKTFSPYSTKWSPGKPQDLLEEIREEVNVRILLRTGTSYIFDRKWNDSSGFCFSNVSYELNFSLNYHQTWKLISVSLKSIKFFDRLPFNCNFFNFRNLQRRHIWRLHRCQEGSRTCWIFSQSHLAGKNNKHPCLF